MYMEVDLISVPELLCLHCRQYMGNYEARFHNGEHTDQDGYIELLPELTADEAASWENGGYVAAETGEIV